MALADRFWGEVEVDAFGRIYDLEQLPAYVALADGQVVGAASYSVEGAQIHLVALQVLPEYQGRGAGGALVEAVLDEGRQAGAEQAILVTTNDNLPALGLYQRIGFVITEVIPGAVVGYHGGVEEVGFAGIPVRDEIRMAFSL
jgi:ribosomal protein S18 acetylase RimI-like enzyme